MNYKSPKTRQNEENAQKLARIEENKAWATTLLTRIKFRNTTQMMKVYDNYVDIINGPEHIPVGYAEKKFKEIINNKLKNWSYL